MGCKAPGCGLAESSERLRPFIATVIALAALVVSYRYGGFLGTGTHQTLHEILAISGAVVFLLSAVIAVIAVRCATNDILGLVYVPDRLSDARVSTLRLLCLLSGYVLVVFGALSLLHVPVGRLLLGGVLTGVIEVISPTQSRRIGHPGMSLTAPT